MKPQIRASVCEKCNRVNAWDALHCEWCGGPVRPIGIELPTWVPPPEPSPTNEPPSPPVEPTPLPEVKHEPQDILNDRSVCIRIITALKSGRAPREGVRYLSVGLDGTIQRLQGAFERASHGEAQILWAIGDYGEGKSHLLRLITALAEEHRFAWAYVVHDKDQYIGLHKPAWLFRQILWSLQWEHPSLSLWRFHDEMTRPPLYDRWWRYGLPKKLAELTDWLKGQGWQGLVVCLDEVENCCQLHWNQHYPAWETLSQLCRQLNGSVLLCVSLTSGGLRTLKGLWRYYANEEAEALLSSADTNSVTMPPWSKSYALSLAEQIHRIHATAFGWQPTVSAEEIAMKASEQAEAAQSGRWRTFVQAAVAVLEREHQKRERQRVGIAPQVVTKPPEPSVTAPKPSTLVSFPPPKSLLPNIQPGDRVEIVRTAFRGFRGIVEQVKGGMAEIVLDGRTQMRVRLPLDALKKLR